MYSAPFLSSTAGDSACPGCRPRFQTRWLSLDGLFSAAEEDCPYCDLLLRGLLSLVPDVAASHGVDAKIRFHTNKSMVVYNDPNGSLGYRPDLPDLEFDIDYFAAGTQRAPLATASTGSHESLTRAWSWIENCVTNHVLCGKDEERELPTRILDLGDIDDEDDGEEEYEPRMIKLVESATGRKEQYVALSHSWGKEQPLKTTEATLEEHQAGIEVSRLPRTFRDAIQITKRLGIRYLWIDSLCIIQDSMEDWQTEASRMAHVYRNSWLTISATNSTSTTSGCFNQGRAVTVRAEDDEDDTLSVLFPAASRLRRDLRLTLQFSRRHPDFTLSAPKIANKEFPLLGRGWAYQERLLAPRVLHFGPHELFWECMQDLDCECGQMKWSNTENMGSYMSRNTTGELPPKIAHYAALHVGAGRRHNNDQQQQHQNQQPQTQQQGRRERENGPNHRRNKKLIARWEEMVTEYSQRALTYGTDRLPAFSGVAAEMVDALGMEYCAGMWRETLPVGLMWERSNNTELATARTDPWPAPSWSWASVNAPVRFLLPTYGPYKQWEKPKLSCELKEVRCVPAGRDARGQVILEESYIVLSAEVRTVPLWYQRSQFSDHPARASVAISNGKTGPVAALNGSYMLRAGKENHVSFIPDIQICDADGNWLWRADEQVFCAKILTSADLFYWLVLRQVPGEADVFERIGALGNTEANWKCEGGRRVIKII